MKEREREGRGTAKRPFCFKFSDMTFCRLLCCEAVLSYSLAVIEFATRLLCSKPICSVFLLEIYLIELV